jgi:hypothetical protein
MCNLSLLFTQKSILHLIRSPTYLVPPSQKLICISPGGFKGFYMFGICKYIHEKYPLENVLFSGASAGAWCSLFLSFTGQLNELQHHLLDHSIQHAKSVIEMENIIKKQLLHQYSKEDFQLNRLYIGVTTLEKCQIQTTIHSPFESLDDAVNACIASSHIPFITGKLLHTYRNQTSFDGGFSKYPFLRSIKPCLFITPNMWNPEKKDKQMTLEDYTTLLSKNKYNFEQLIQDGYLDAMKNKAFLDAALLSCNENL